MCDVTQFNCTLDALQVGLTIVKQLPRKKLLQLTLIHPPPTDLPSWINAHNTIQRKNTPNRDSNSQHPIVSVVVTQPLNFRKIPELTGMWNSEKEIVEPLEFFWKSVREKKFLDVDRWLAEHTTVAWHNTWVTFPCQASCHLTKSHCFFLP